MKFKNIFFTLLLVIGLFFLVSFANAEETTNTTPTTVPAEATSTPAPTTASTSTREGELKKVLPLQKKLTNEIQSLKSSTDEKKMTVNNLKAGFGSAAGRITGTVTATTATSLTVKTDQKIVTVTADSTTKCERHYFGTCTFFEIAVNDKVQAFGTYSDDSKTTLQAKIIRDASIMKKFGTFLGDVTSKGTTSFVIKSKERGDQTVNFSTTTKLVTRLGVTMTIDDLLVGHRVLVRGVWDKANNTVSEVTLVKDFSLPIQVDKRVPPGVSPEASTSGTPAPSEAVTISPAATTQ